MDFRLEVWEASQGLATYGSCRQYQERAVAVRRDRHATLEKMADDLDGPRPIPEILGRPASRQHEPVILVRLNLREPDVRLDPVSGFLRVGIEAGLEIVDNGEEGPPFGCRDVHLPSFLFEAILRVINLLRFSRIAGEQEDPQHKNALDHRARNQGCVWDNLPTGQS